MTTMRGNAGGYGMGAPSYGGGMNDSQQESSALDAIRQQTSKIEDMLDTVAEPLKPYDVPSRSHGLSQDSGGNALLTLF